MTSLDKEEKDPRCRMKEAGHPNSGARSKPTPRLRRCPSTIPIGYESQPEGAPWCICIHEERDSVGHLRWVAVASQRRPTWHISMQTHASRVLQDPPLADLKLYDLLQGGTIPFPAY